MGAMSTLVQRRRFTVDEYECMVKAGIIHEDERVELLDGEIVEMAAIGSRHMACVNRLTYRFGPFAPNRFILSVQNSVRVSESFEPQPDVVLLRLRPDFYVGAVSQPEDVLLIVEVADSSLGYDRGAKLRHYAEAGIPEVWVANLRRPSDTRYRDPQAGRYQQVAVFRRGASISPLALPEIELRVNEILGDE
jgi:Uma2 family endonuclease